MNLIDTTIITYEIAVTEDALRTRLQREVLESLGLIHDDKPAPGVSVHTPRTAALEGKAQ